MPKISAFFHDRSLSIYYALFAAGAVVVVYQAQEWRVIGDSVDLICFLFFMSGFTVRTRSHLLENTALVTAGYILPLLIRNAVKLSYVEAPSKMAFAELGLRSLTITVMLGIAFTSVGFILKHLSVRFYYRSRGTVSTRTTVEPDKLE
jgi:hypothetical protein